MAKVLNMPEDYPEFKDYIVYKIDGEHYVRAKNAAQQKKEAVRVAAGLEPERITFFEWVRQNGC